MSTIKFVLIYAAVGYVVSLVMLCTFEDTRKGDYPRYGSGRFGDDVAIGLLGALFWPMVLAVLVTMPVAVRLARRDGLKWFNPFFYLYHLPFRAIERIMEPKKPKEPKRTYKTKKARKGNGRDRH